MSQKTIMLLFFAVLMISFSNVNGQSKITSIQAKLFYNQKSDMDTSPGDKVSGTFSKQDIINDKGFALWNTITGAGDAEGPSNQTIIIVAIKSLNLSNKNQILRLTVSMDKKVIQSETRAFSAIGNKVDYKLLFLVNNTGCGKLTLKADLINSVKTISTMTRFIDFECGE